jgi:hypothetical protein
MSTPLPFENTCTTPFGRFQIKVDPMNIHVGGTKSCVTIAISNDKTELGWLGTEEGSCTLDYRVIQGADTIRMLDLAFSLLRKYFPTRNIVTLFDDSGAYITDRTGKRIKVRFSSAYCMLYGKTWYEDKFGATMIDMDDYIAYRHEVDNNFDDPSKKPASFDFGSVNDELQPLYQTSATWREFMDKIKRHYPGKLKYKIMAEWHLKAFYKVIKRTPSPFWKIDITNRPIYECNPLEGGSRRKRHLRTRNGRSTFPTYYPLEPYYENEPTNWGLPISPKNRKHK